MKDGLLSHRVETGDDTSAIPTPPLSSCFLLCLPQLSQRQTQLYMCTQGRGHIVLLCRMGVIFRFAGIIKTFSG